MVVASYSMIGEFFCIILISLSEGSPSLLDLEQISHINKRVVKNHEPSGLVFDNKPYNHGHTDVNRLISLGHLRRRHQKSIIRNQEEPSKMAQVIALLKKVQFKSHPPLKSSEREAFVSQIWQLAPEVAEEDQCDLLRFCKRNCKYDRCTDPCVAGCRNFFDCSEEEKDCRTINLSTVPPLRDDYVDVPWSACC